MMIKGLGSNVSVRIPIGGGSACKNYVDKKERTHFCIVVSKGSTGYTINYTEESYVKSGVFQERVTYSLSFDRSNCKTELLSAARTYVNYPGQ